MSGNNEVEKTSQYMDNLSFDKVLQVNAVEILGYDGSVLRKIKTNTDGSLVTDSKETTDLEGKGIVAVGTSAVELTFTGTPQTINIESVMGNSGTIYVGKSNVTTAGANALASLQPGASIQIDFNDSTNAIYVVSSVAAQSVIAGCLI